MSMKRRAFTLIELLVVIAVIGILAAIFLPALARSKAVAKQIHCVGNVKQLALAAHLYAVDNADWLPPHSQNNWEARRYLGGKKVWHHLLLDGYLDGNTNVFQCAGNSRLKKVFPNDYDYGTRLFNLAYGWNVEVGNEKSIKLSQVVSPSDHLQLGDTAGWLYTPRTQWMDYPPLPAINPVIDYKPVYSVYQAYFFELTRRHSGKSNMAFSDGHVEHGSLRDWTLPIESVHRRWHYDNQARLDRLTHRNADNWHPLRGVDEPRTEPIDEP